MLLSPSLTLLRLSCCICFFIFNNFILCFPGQKISSTHRCKQIHNVNKNTKHFLFSQALHGWHSEILKKLKKAGVQGPPRPRQGAGFKIKYAQTYLRQRRALLLSRKCSLTSGRCLLQWIPRYTTNLTRIFSYFKKILRFQFSKNRFSI